MRGGLRLGRIFGIDIFIDWSWIFIFLLVTWNLAAGVFPQAHQNWGTGTCWIVAIVAAVLFFASILVHELAHSLVAKARGLPVRRITLFLFGGVSNIEREPSSPGVELVMAAVGPLTSILLGVIFLLLAGFRVNVMSDTAHAISEYGPLATLLLWLGPINILLGVFNMVPGFPLDGGRVLRSILWKITGDLRKATRLASWVGQTIAWLFIIAGISMAFGAQLPVLGSGIIGGLWLAFIGWFLNNAASASYQQVMINDVLGDMTVARLMRTNVPTVPPGITVDQFVHDYVMATDDQSFPVVDQNRLLGLVSLHDVRSLPVAQWQQTLVSQIMTPADRLAVLGPGEEASDALNKLASRDVRQMPVLEDGRLIGILRRQDILKWLQLHTEPRHI